MTKDEAIQLLWETVRDNLRHPNYERTVKLAKKYFRFTTGDGLDEDLQKFQPRESDDMFEQRKNITKHIVPTVVKNLMDVQYKVPRSNSLTRTLEYEGDKENKKLQKFEDILGKFWGDKSFDDYMGVRMVELNNLDPNSFVITEFKDFDATSENAQPYPFEADSEMAVMYEYDNNLLQYLIVRQKITFIKEEKETDGSRHTIYLKEQAIVLEQFWDKSILSLMPQEEEWYVIGKSRYIRKDEDMYIIIEPEPYNLEAVPARRIGFKRDLETKCQSYVAPYHDTIPILEKVIKANSELDLTMALHAFPQKIIMGKKCDNPDCLNGYIKEITKDGKEHKTICPKCQGMGLLPHTTAQDVLIITQPEEREQQLSLDDIVRYIHPPADMIIFQDEYVDKLTQKAKEVMFNSDIFTREEVAETATGKNIDLQNVYDTLWPFAVKYADTWEFFVEIMASLTDMKNGLVYRFTFDKDFKMKTTTELYGDLQKANESGADSFAIQDIQLDIARNIFANNPHEFLKYKVKQDFYPFSGKTKEEIMLIKSSNNTSKFYKVLDDNFGIIFDLIELKYEDFYLLEKNKQWDIIKKTVEELITEIDEQAPATQQFNAE